MGACDSTVERTKDGNHFLITKIFEYGGDNSGILVGPRIFLDDASTVTIKVSCKFLATHTAGSDDISIEAGAAVEGKLETEGSWQDSLTVWAINDPFYNTIFEYFSYSYTNSHTFFVSRKCDYMSEDSI